MTVSKEDLSLLLGALSVLIGLGVGLVAILVVSAFLLGRLSRSP